MFAFNRVRSLTHLIDEIVAVAGGKVGCRRANLSRYPNELTSGETPISISESS
jgi:hypothetical protein